MGNVFNSSGVNPVVGQTVQVWRGDLKVDETKYSVEGVGENDTLVLGVPCSCDKKCECGENTRRVHKSRIARILDNDGKIIQEARVGKEQSMATKAKASKKEQEKVNFQQLKKDGEIWAKDVNFDHESIKAQAIAFIPADQKSFRAFNTYDGSLGKKNNPGKTHPLADDKAYEALVKRLKKKGYKKL
jgi:hypothetical protein